MFAVGDYVMFEGDPACAGHVTDVDGVRVFVVWDDGADNDWFDESQLELVEDCISAEAGRQ